jgi:PadR family transcriptional regulator, regulatory protein PadR
MVPVVGPQDYVYGVSVAVTQERQMGEEKLDLLQGTLDLMVLQTLAAMGEQHGYGIARRIEQVSGNEVLLNQGTIYASLVRLQQRGWIDAEWGVSDNNRKAKFYSITKRGRKQLEESAAYWQRLAAVMGRVLGQAIGHRP